MAMTNAEKQAAFRARRDKRIKELEKQVVELRRSLALADVDQTARRLRNRDEGLQCLLSENARVWAECVNQFCYWFEKEIVDGRMSPFEVGMIGRNLDFLSKGYLGKDKPKKGEWRNNHYRDLCEPGRITPLNSYPIFKPGTMVRVGTSRAHLKVIEDPGPVDSHARKVKLQPLRGEPFTERRNVLREFK